MHKSDNNQKHAGISETLITEESRKDQRNNHENLQEKAWKIMCKQFHKPFKIKTQ